MTQMRFRHVLLTMFNWRLDRAREAFKAFDELDDNWLRYRWQLFMRYTVPSVAAQSNSDFTWVVLCHPQSPDWLRARTATVTMKADVHFSFQRQDPVLDRFADGAADALLVTRIDSDDAWHRRAMERFREDCEADPYTSEIVMLTDGYLLDNKAGRIRPYYEFSSPFYTKISHEPGLDPLDIGGNHTEVRRRYPARSISDGEPMFTVVEHEQRRRGRACDPADPRWLTCSATAEILDRDFSVTLTDGGSGQPGRSAGLTRHRPARPAAALPSRSAQDVTLRRQRVVVSIPCFQSWDSVPRAVESILAQTYPDLLVVVTNDGDADPYWDALSHVDDPRLVRIDHAANRGRHFVDQVVLMARLGQYLLIQDAGGWSEPDRVRALLLEMRRRHGTAAVSAHYQHGFSSPGEPESQPPGPPAVVGPGPAAAPVTALYPDRPDRASWYHALFDAPRLLNVGGCYGGHRFGYDTFLLQLMRMTGAIAALDQPLYHRFEHWGSEASRLGQASDHASPAELARLHGEAYHVYCEYLQGNIGFSLLSRQLRSLAWRHVSASEWDALRDEAYRLRWTVRANGSDRS
jgi:glycosyltransferase involved in cell wall biosynthesis